MNKENFSAAVIAGGKSRRFGRSKLFIQWQNEWLIQRALKLAASIADDHMVVSGESGLSSLINAPVHADLFSNSGPLGGIYTALKKAPCGHVVILPVDMPLINRELYQLIYRFYSFKHPVVAKSIKGLEPMVSIWPVESHKIIENMLQKGDLSIRHAFKVLSADVVYVPDEMDNYDDIIFENVNTPYDLERLKQKLPGKA
ncbi:MAG: NTP transferase domain-containing protein [Caldithrix sp.]|nr:NTP transferase domain-containing protein [Caldithrix sp.]